MFLVQLLGTTDSTAACDGDRHFENQVTHTQFLCTRSDSLPVTSERASAAAEFSTFHRRQVAHTKTSSAGIHIKPTRFSLGAW